MKIIEKFKYILNPDLRAHDVAMAFSIGAFISILPTIGMSLLLGLGILSLFPKLNKLSMGLAFLIFNPIILAPIYTLSYRLGDWIFATEPVLKFKINILNQLFIFSRRFLMGNLIIAFMISILSYFLIRGILRYKKKRTFPWLK